MLQQQLVWPDLQQIASPSPGEGLLLCPDGQHRRRVRKLMQECGYSVVEVSNRESVLQRCGTASFVVIVCPALTTADIAALRRLEEPGATPCVLVTSSDPHNLLRLGKVRVDEVVLLNELELGLPRAAQRLVTLNARARAALAFERTTALSTAVRRAGSTVCTSDRVIRSVQSLAVELSITPDGLCKAWRTTILYERGVHLRDFVATAAVWRVALVRCTTTSWTSASKLFDIPPEWLRDCKEISD